MNKAKRISVRVVRADGSAYQTTLSPDLAIKLDGFSSPGVQAIRYWPRQLIVETYSIHAKGDGTAWGTEFTRFEPVELEYLLAHIKPA